MEKERLEVEIPEGVLPADLESREVEAAIRIMHTLLEEVEHLGLDPDDPNDVRLLEVAPVVPGNEGVAILIGYGQAVQRIRQIDQVLDELRDEQEPVDQVRAEVQQVAVEVGDNSNVVN